MKSRRRRFLARADGPSSAADNAEHCPYLKTSTLRVASITLLFTFAAPHPVRLFAVNQPVATPTNNESEAKSIGAVKVAQLDFILPKEKDPKEPRSLERFFGQNGNRHYYTSDAGTDWDKKWDLFSKALIQKAVTVQLDDKNLKHCLEALSLVKHSSLYQGAKQQLAVIPTEAYLAKHEKGSCWIIVCQWEEIVESEPYIILGHTRIWAVDTQSYDVIAFTTCD